MRDRIYSEEKQHIVDFAFDQQVAGVFPDMIRRSVPGYETMVPMTGLIAARHLGDHGLAYDLGCSLGAISLAILQQNTSADIRVIAVDSSQAMIADARHHLRDPRATLLQQDVRDTEVTDADVVILNLVLQFIPTQDRLPLLQRIHAQMHPNGLLLVAEKVSHTDPDMHSFYTTTHEAWKQANGYSTLEVSQKRSALENVMHIDSEADHTVRFQAAGFTRVDQWYRCMNWAAFMVRP